MKWFLILTFSFLISCQENDKHLKENFVEGSEIRSVDYDGLESYINNHPSQTLIINFWATWCAPCIKELPAFESIGKKYANDNTSVLLVSLDFPDQLEKLKDFVKKKEIQSEVVFLNDGDGNSWIPKVDKDWSGAIPATLIKSDKRKQFYERSFSYEELEIEYKKITR